LKKSKKKLRILVADDNDDIRDILSHFLSRCGHKVKTVDNGTDAINMTDGDNFDLVLCDLAMPIVSGYDVVKALNGSKKIPKIGIITGCNGGLQQEAGKELKVDFILKKPFKHLALAEHINIVFSQV
jgi:CheY-like chemotaxis protein